MAETSSRIAKTENPQVSHEQSDVNVRRILAFGLGLLVAGVVIQLGMWWLFVSLAARTAQLDQPRSPLASSSPRESLPPEPRLQVSPAQDLKELRAAEDALLHSYGWVDQQAGVVRIPIERAMELLAEHWKEEEKGARGKAKGGRTAETGASQTREGEQR